MDFKWGSDNTPNSTTTTITWTGRTVESLANEFQCSKHEIQQGLGQLESAYPVSGSVLVHDDSVYFAAGKSAFLDDGIYLYRLNAMTGEKVSETQVYLLDSDGIQPKIDWLAMPGMTFTLDRQEISDSGIHMTR